ncbi:alpha/beta fold hydrolase [Novosphingobium piscinae]|uniref:Alpha/beta hydrolase n=1 Tax=Novosphingobium piscinae TaxID=1507448 RepID=A0A7X1G0Y1_9SPHN|nr:alpha/beta hydrolase [Novosphingobium piscinae]MBC2670596.1 alpha/beta hydrolase [Novosphingobium piscinae]
MSASPTCLTVAVAGRRIHVATWGQPNAPVVMLIHGMRDHCRSWDWIAPVLAEHYRVIAPDLRGHGESDWAGSDGYALPGYVADIADVAQALGLDRYAIVGHSLGGAIGLRVTAAFPDRVVAFAGVECIELPIHRDEAREPTPYPQRLRQWLERRQAAAIHSIRHYPTLEDACARMQREQPDIPAATVRHLVEHATVCDAGLGWRWKFDPRVRLRAPEDQRASDLDEVLDAVTCPVLLFYGDAGWIPVPGAPRLSRLGQYRISHYPGGGHWLHHQFTGRFTAEVLAFLDANCRTTDHA